MKNSSYIPSTSNNIQTGVVCPTPGFRAGNEAPAPSFVWHNASDSLRIPNRAFAAVWVISVGCLLSGGGVFGQVRDDFDSYGLGEFPPSWIANANAQSEPRYNCVTRDPENPGNQVLQLFGSQPNNWSTLVFRRCPLSGAFEVRFRAYVEEEFQGSPGGFTCQISQQPDWRAPARALVAFGREGQVTVAGREGLPYRYGRWYCVRAIYEQAGNQVSVSAWVNGQSVGRNTIATEDAVAEDSLHYLCFNGRGRFYIDDVVISPVSRLRDHAAPPRLSPRPAVAPPASIHYQRHGGDETIIVIRGR